MKLMSKKFEQQLEQVYSKIMVSFKFPDPCTELETSSFIRFFSKMDSQWEGAPSEPWFGCLSCHKFAFFEPVKLISHYLVQWMELSWIQKLFTCDSCIFVWSVSFISMFPDFCTTQSMSFTCNSKVSSCFCGSWLKPTSLIFFLPSGS